ncbi:MAG: hypothetical protein K2M11_08960 [Paramuribaculum sp.]|nr:hypothetical protein [Paramuribaculum sp.]
MKRRFLIILAIVFVLLCVAYAAVSMLSSQSNIRVEKSEGALCYLPILSTPPEVELVPGIRFKLDTGSDLSTITEEDLARLDSLGFYAEESFYPVIGRDGNGSINIKTKRYTVSLPLLKYEIRTDSLGNRYGVGKWKDANIIHNVEFAPSLTGKSVLGIDFLQKFRVEYLFNDRAIALYLDEPDGYVTCTDIIASKAPLSIPMLGKRYFVDFKVDGHAESFFLDTGIRAARIKMPAGEAINSRGRLADDTIVSAIGEFPAKVSDNAIVSIGERTGLGKVYYYDSKEEPYAFNPFNLFLQDALIDFPNRVLKLRPVYKRSHTIPELVSYVTIED